MLLLKQKAISGVLTPIDVTKLQTAHFTDPAPYWYMSSIWQFPQLTCATWFAATNYLELIPYICRNPTFITGWFPIEQMKNISKAYIFISCTEILSFTMHLLISKFYICLPISKYFSYIINWTKKISRHQAYEIPQSFVGSLFSLLLKVTHDCYIRFQEVSFEGIQSTVSCSCGFCYLYGS